MSANDSTEEDTALAGASGDDVSAGTSVSVPAWTRSDTRSGSAITAFADAFRLRKDRPDE